MGLLLRKPLHAMTSPHGSSSVLQHPNRNAICLMFFTFWDDLLTYVAVQKIPLQFFLYPHDMLPFSQRFSNNTFPLGLARPGLCRVRPYLAHFHYPCLGRADSFFFFWTTSGLVRSGRGYPTCPPMD